MVGDQDFLKKVVAWANGRADIVALIMTGSRARPDGMADALSDYDVEMFTTDPGRYTSSTAWMRDIGKVWVYLPTTSNGCETRLVVFDGGAKVDFSILSVRALELAVKSQELDELYERGFRVLIDKNGLASRLPSPSYSPPKRQRPTEAEFRAAVEEFWFEASHIPKYLRREDLWVVKFRDWTMKELLLRIMEWRTIAVNGDAADVWHIGMRMKDWVPSNDWLRLNEVYGRFDAADSWRALLATLSLFRDVATETANKLGYEYPAEVDESISGYIRRFEGSPFAV